MPCGFSEHALTLCGSMNLVDLLHPSAAFPMLQGEQLIVLPVKMIGETGYLLVKLSEGVANHFPSLSGSTSNPFSQKGQTTFIAEVPLPLIRL
jgi:hypothetical protein